MADNLNKIPKRSILKKDGEESNTKQCKWDEMNILETYHPENKDYGHMKIDEPKTPYNYENPEDVQTHNFDASLLSNKLHGDMIPKVMQEESDNDETVDYLTQDQKLHKKEFEHKRKAHYNEFLAVQNARQMAMEDDEEETA